MVLGSITSQRTLRVASSVNGSRMAVSASGMRIMSDSSMPFHPLMEEPSNIFPSSKKSASILLAGRDMCISLPRVSVKRRSTIFTSFSFNILSTSSADMT